MPTYNGWSNWETWLVALHYEPTSKEELDIIKDHIEEEIGSIESIFIKDLLGGAEINWRELEDRMED